MLQITIGWKKISKKIRKYPYQELNSLDSRVVKTVSLSGVTPVRPQLPQKNTGITPNGSNEKAA